MASELTKDDVEIIKDSFQALDIDGDGEIARCEIKEFFKNYSDDKIDSMMRLLDSDMDGMLTFLQFMEAFALLEYGKGKLTSQETRQLYIYRPKH